MGKRKRSRNNNWNWTLHGYSWTSLINKIGQLKIMELRQRAQDKMG
jgi:hypothetical protein